MDGINLLLQAAAAAIHLSFSVIVLSPVLQSLVVSLVLSHLNYGDATLSLVEISPYYFRRFQSTMNYTAELIYSSLRFRYITPFLRRLHSLVAMEQIDFKVTVLTVQMSTGVRAT